MDNSELLEGSEDYPDSVRTDSWLFKGGEIFGLPVPAGLGAGVARTGLKGTTRLGPRLLESLTKLFSRESANTSTRNGQRYYVEYEGLANPRGAAHELRILANDPGSNFILRIVP